VFAATDQKSLGEIKQQTIDKFIRIVFGEELVNTSVNDNSTQQLSYVSLIQYVYIDTLHYI